MITLALMILGSLTIIRAKSVPSCRASLHPLTRPDRVFLQPLQHVVFLTPVRRSFTVKSYIQRLQV